MTTVAITIRHRTLPGRRDQVRAVWEKHMRPAIAANPGHLAYFYCFDSLDPDVICAFQLYETPEAARRFLTTEAYGAYVRETRGLLAAAPEVTSLTPLWAKGDPSPIDGL